MIKLKNVSDIKRNMLLNFVYKGLGMIASLIYIPIVLSFLGDENYGIWTTIYSFVSWINYFDIGIGNGLRNQLTKYIAINDYEKAKKVNSTAYLSLSLLSLIIIIIFGIITIYCNLGEAWNLQISNENINSIIIINAIFIGINFVLNLGNTALYALQFSSLVNLKILACQVLEVVVIVIISINFKSSLLILTFVYGITIMMVNILSNFILYKKYKYLVPKINCFDSSELKKINEFGLKMFVTQMSSLVLNATDNILISKYFGAKNVTPYNTIFKILNVFSAFHCAMIIPMWSAYTKALAEKKYEWIIKGLRKMMLLVLPFIMGIILISIFFKPLSAIWLGKKLDYKNGVILITCLYFCVLSITNVFSSFLTGIGKVNIMTIVALAQAILNIPISIILSKYFGVSGIIMGSLIVMLIALVILPLESLKYVRDLKRRQLYER